MFLWERAQKTREVLLLSTPERDVRVEFPDPANRLFIAFSLRDLVLFRCHRRFLRARSELRVTAARHHLDDLVREPLRLAEHVRGENGEGDFRAGKGMTADFFERAEPLDLGVARPLPHEAQVELRLALAMGHLDHEAPGSFGVFSVGERHRRRPPRSELTTSSAARRASARASSESGVRMPDVRRKQSRQSKRRGDGIGVPPASLAATWLRDLPALLF